jgi:methionyl-tRNA formyltransferase
MRVMIVGQKWLGAEALRLCTERGDDVAAVCVPRLDDRLAAAAAEAGVPVCQVSGPLDGRWMPPGLDLVLCAHSHTYIAREARQAARWGALGYHPSLLPRHRGRDAVRWALHMGDPVTGGTAYWMDDGADTGPVAAQAWCFVRPGDTPETLWRRDLAPMGVHLFGRVLADLDRGRRLAVPQDAELATWEPAFRQGPLREL